MVLELLTSFGYEAVRQSWLVSTVMVKYVLILIGIEAYYRNGPDIDSYIERINQRSEGLVAFIVSLGLVNVFLEVPLEPVLELPSQLIALGYFGYLFWKY